MNKVDTLKFIKFSSTLLITFFIFYVIRIDQWQFRGFTVFILVFLCIMAPLLLISFLSLFAPHNQYEGVTKKVFQETPVLAKVVVWITLSCMALLIALADFTPLPTSIYQFFLLTSWVAALAGIVSQRIVIGVLHSIFEDDEKTWFTLANRYLNALLFGVVFVIFTRIYRLPWYIRKATGIVLMVCLCLAFMISIRVFNP